MLYTIERTSAYGLLLVSVLAAGCSRAKQIEESKASMIKALEEPEAKELITTLKSQLKELFKSSKNDNPKDCQLEAILCKIIAHMIKVQSQTPRSMRLSDYLKLKGQIKKDHSENLKKTVRAQRNARFLLVRSAC